MHGYSDKNSNFLQVIKSLGKHSNDIKNWLKNNSKFKWLSHDIQNKIFELAFHEILHHITEDIQNSGNGYFSIIVDETVDIAVKEQLLLCICYVDNKWRIKEVFLRLVETPSCDAKTFKAMQSCLFAFGLSFEEMLRSSLQQSSKHERPLEWYSSKN